MQLIADSKGKSSALWKHLNTLTNRASNMKRSNVEFYINGTVSNDVLEIANEFNKLFTKSVEELATNFRPIDFDDIQRDLSTSFHIKEVNQSEIGKVIMELRQSKAKDYFGLDTLIIKKHSSVVQLPVTHVVNCSIRSNVFPEPWKKAFITNTSLVHLTWSLCFYLACTLKSS